MTLIKVGISIGMVTVCLTGPLYANDPNLEKIKALQEMTKQLDSVSQHEGRIDEETSETYADLVGQVAALRDPRAVPALVGAINTGGMATDALAAFGDAALDSVIVVTHEKDELRVFSALFTLEDMLKPDNIRHFKDVNLAKKKIKDVFERFKTYSDKQTADLAQEGLAQLKSIK